MTQSPVYSAAQIACNKFASYIESSKTQAHLSVSKRLIDLYKMRFPTEVTLTSELSIKLQKKRLELVGEYKTA